MKTHKHLMVDIETLSTRSNAVICSLSAIPFCPHTGDTGVPFSRTIDIQSCLDMGLQVDGDTIYWWMGQSEAALEAIYSGREPLAKVLVELNAFIGENLNKEFFIWGKGPGFDMARLADAYHACQINKPWSHLNERCVRTEMHGYEKLIKEQVPFEGEKHKAEDDTRHQIKQLVWVNKNRSKTHHYNEGDY